MSLRKQWIAVPALKGVDAGDVEPRIQQEAFLKAENCVIERRGAITKRYGFANLTGTHAEKHIAEYQNRPVLFGPTIKTKAGATAVAGDFDTIDDAIMADLSDETLIFSADDKHFRQDVEELGNVRAVMYSSLVNGLEIRTYDVNSGAQLDKVTLTGSLSYMTGVLLNNGTDIYYYYANDAVTPQLWYGVINSVTGVIGARVDISTHGAVPTPKRFTPCLDGVFVGDAASSYMALTYIEKTTDDIAIVFFTGSSLNQTTLVSGGTAFLTTAICRWGDPVNDDRVLIISCEDMGSGQRDLNGAVYDTGASQIIAPLSSPGFASWASTTGEIINQAGHCPHPNTGRAEIYYTRQIDPDHLASAPWPAPFINHVQVSESGGSFSITTTANILLRQHALAAKPFLDSSAKDYIIGCFEEWRKDYADRIQRSLHLIKITDHPAGVGNPPTYVPIGRALVNRASFGITAVGGSNTTYRCGLPKVASTATDEFITVAEDKSAHGVQYPLYARGTALIRIDLTDSLNIRTIEGDTNLWIPTAIGLDFDGREINEQGFLIYPHEITGVIDGTGGSWVTGTYAAVAIYEAYDTQGNVHRSAPCAAGSVVVTGAAQRVRWDAPSLPLTMRSVVYVHFYREATAGTGRYQYLSSVINDVLDADDIISVYDLGADISAERYIYTDGGEIENICPPPHRISALHQQRYFAVDRSREKSRIYYSHQAIANVGLSMTDVFRISVNADDGEITMLESHADKLIIGKRNRIYATYGVGKNLTGLQGGYREPYLISEAVGCTEQHTLVRTPRGLMFLSDQGIVLLDKALNINFIGRRVKWHTDNNTFRVGVLRANKNEAVWFSDDTAIVYNYLYDEWTTWTNHGAKDACVANGTYYFIKDGSSAVAAEDPSVYDDAGTKITMTIESGIISLAKMLGFKRIYEIDWLLECPLGSGDGTGESGMSATEPGIVALWRMNETADTDDAIDATGNGHTGATDAFPDRDPIVVPGRFGNARRFSYDETVSGEWWNRRFIVSHHANLKPANLTLSCWVYLENSDGSVAANKKIICPDPSLGKAYTLKGDVVGSGVIVFDLLMDDASWVNVTPTVTLNQGWHYIVATYDGTDARMYYDGVLVKTTIPSGSTVIDMNTCSLYIGNGSTNSNFPGYIDELAVFNVAKDADWVAQQYAYGAFPTFGVQFQFDHAPYWWPQQTLQPALDKPFNYEAFYGAGLSVDYKDQALILTCAPDRQKCTAFRWKLTDGVAAASSRVALIAMGLLYGIKRGPVQSGQEI